MCDNAQPHTAPIMKALLTNLKLDVFGHLPDSLDLAPSDFYLSFSLKKSLGRQLLTKDELGEACRHSSKNRMFNGITQVSEN